jgi:tRNA A-37 threonylcarbamoyl transferase component Bud32
MMAATAAANARNDEADVAINSQPVEKDPNCDDPVERWRRRAEQLEKCIEEINLWRTFTIHTDLNDDSDTVSHDTSPCLEAVNQCFGGTCCDRTTECKICTLRGDYNNAVQELKSFLSDEQHPASLRTAIDGFLEETDEDIIGKPQSELEKERALLIKLEKLRIKERIEAAICAQATTVMVECFDIHKHLNGLFDKLLVLASFGNETSSATTSTKSVARSFSGNACSGSLKRSLPSSVDDQSSSTTSAKKVCLTPPTTTNGLLFARATVPDPISPTTMLLLETEPNVVTTLNEFKSYLEHGFEKVMIGTKAEAAETIKLILAWKFHKEKCGFVVESLDANDLKVSHKVIYAILFKIASILKVEAQTTTHEQTTEAEDMGQRHNIDYVIGCVCNHLQVSRLHTCIVPFEFKALANNAGKSFHWLQQKGFYQIVGHLARSLLPAFCFGGVGIDCTVRGAVLSLVSVEILELELKDAGTSNARLLFRTSGNQPLFDEAATNALLQSPTAFKSIFPDFNGPSQGFEYLAGLMSPVNHGLVFSYGDAFYSDNAAERVALESYLGSGTYSNVYDLKEEDSFIKVPKDRERIEDFEEEMLILKALNDERIPKAAAELGLLQIYLRCETSVVQCLRMEGVVGESASKFYFGDRAEIVWVCNEVSKALDHAHSRGIAHLDVRPSNIIVSRKGQAESEALHVQLIDWGLAARFEKSLSGFRGCLPYAHDELLAPKSKKDWLPAPKHDFASLAYTLTTLVFRMELGSSSIPWHGFFDKCVKPVALAARKERVVKCLANLAVESSDALGGVLPPAVSEKLRDGAGIKSSEFADALRGPQEESP